MRIGIDLLGGDESPQVLFEAVLSCLGQRDPSISFVVIGLERPPDCPLDFVQAEESISMEDSPLYVVRRKRKSSMAVGIQLLKEGKIDALVSTGNTGALVAFASLYLKLFPGISKPALLASLPTERGRVAVLDVGAHVSFKPEHLMNYAKMGVFYSHIAMGIVHPKIGLLNIGAEEKKGTQEIKEAYWAMHSYFSSRQCQFVGNVEGKDVFQGKVDVLVTDGFTGNVFLKTCEGASSFLLDYIGRLTAKAGHSQLLNHLSDQFNYEGHPGALLCGFENLIIKCHGYSTAKALSSGILGTIDLLHKNFISKMKEMLATS